MMSQEPPGPKKAVFRLLRGSNGRPAAAMVRREPLRNFLRPPPGDTMNPNRAQLSLPWLVRLRWRLLAAEAAAVLVADRVFAFDMPLARLLVLLGVAAAANTALQRLLERDGSLAHVLCACVLALDVVVLTAILHASGGPSNPFSVLYLVYITLAALLLGSASTWSLTLLSIGAYGSLFFLGSTDPHAGHDHDAFVGHLQAMWIAFSLTAALTAGSVVRLTAAIQTRDREIDEIRERATSSQRLAALTTLAAGAAHELGSPLGTIALAAGELDRSVSRLPEAERVPLLDDVRLIRSQLQRCRQILEQMSAAGGEFAGETPVTLSLGDLVDEVRAELTPAESSRLVLHLHVAEATLVPHRAFARVLICLLRNAFDASGDAVPVELSVGLGAGGDLEVSVRDRGHGMTPEVLARATEPFFTTKTGGEGIGMGMGLFLANALAEQFGGHLTLQSAPGSGTTALLVLPQRLPQAGGRVRHA